MLWSESCLLLPNQNTTKETFLDFSLAQWNNAYGLYYSGYVPCGPISWYSLFFLINGDSLSMMSVAFMSHVNIRIDFLRVWSWRKPYLSDVLVPGAFASELFHTPENIVVILFGIIFCSFSPHMRFPASITLYYKRKVCICVCTYCWCIKEETQRPTICADVPVAVNPIVNFGKIFWGTLISMCALTHTSI